MALIANCGVEGSEEEGVAVVDVVVDDGVDVVILVINSEVVVRELIFRKACG
jgi:Fe2+ transport system protein B